MCKYVESTNIGDAYLQALRLLINGRRQYLIVHISNPVHEHLLMKCPSSSDIDDWLEIINVGDFYEKFSNLKLYKGCRYGKSGKDWINDRIYALLHRKGVYFRRIENQLEMVEKRLQARDKKGRRMHGSCTNALVCQVFDSHDLENACKPRPNAKNLPCLTMIDFKPKGDRLSLLAVFRSQYIDTKAYGNFISLAILLYKMCSKTKYKPGALISMANNVTFHDQRHRELLKNLLEGDSEFIP